VTRRELLRLGDIVEAIESVRAHISDALEGTVRTLLDQSE
jgi:hypothetical protein